VAGLAGPGRLSGRARALFVSAGGEGRGGGVVVAGGVGGVLRGRGGLLTCPWG